MTISNNDKLKVTVYAIATNNFCGSTSDLDKVFPDIYMPNSLGENKEDLGTDKYHYSINGDSEMVMIDKGLLLALIDQNQRLSENEAIYDDSRNTSYKWKDLNKLVMGINFPDIITNN